MNLKLTVVYKYDSGWDGWMTVWISVENAEITPASEEPEIKLPTSTGS